MRAKAGRITFVLILGGVLILLLTREAREPLSGIWIGNWGTAPTHRMDITVEFKWDGKTLTGAVNPGPGAIWFRNTSFDSGTGTVHLEADVSYLGNVTRYIINGKVEGRTMFGTWAHGDRRGDFRLLKR